MAAKTAELQRPPPGRMLPNMGTTAEPALATLSHERFWEDGWIFERKLDGQRCLAVRHDGDTRLLSRTGSDTSAAFPEVVEALAQYSRDFVVDGEVVAFEGSRTSFARLQPRIHLTSARRARETGIAIRYYAFDVLEIDGQDVRERPLLDRKRELRRLLSWDDPIRWTPHRVHAGESWFEQICHQGWEGLIAKRADATYDAGRTRNWLKFKCEAGQEFVIVGWSEPAGSRVGLGALLLGYHDTSGGSDDLVYAGKVGTGFTEEMLRDLHDRLAEREVSRSPCTQGALPSVDVRWVRPDLVAEVAFTEWTSAGQLRHPRYLGLRTDKPADDVVRESS